MAKGLFTQGMCVLLRRPIAIATLEERLKGFKLVGRHDSIDDDSAPQTLVFDYRSEVGGHLLVTPSDSPWPDDMGDPDESPERFVAWSLGQFGPLAFPGCLRRASEQCWGWEEGEEESKSHTAHVRLLISYVLGAEDPTDEEDDLPLIPDDYDPLDELNFITRAVTTLLEDDDAICYFNPGGEVLRDENSLRRGLNYAWSHEMPPLDMWTNVRLFHATDKWTLIDTVGNAQLDLPDLEAIYDSEKFDPSDVEAFLRTASLYMMQHDEDVEDGDTADGPGDVTWAAMECHDALSDPPRETIRWVPQDGSVPPDDLLERGEEPDYDEDLFGPDDLLGDDLLGDQDLDDDDDDDELDSNLGI
ncbi:hypothetical protein K227x_26790 [Rubripirellula lacrimiformis]|uniref:DUF4261 domain-containing protein n=1 Tax=Rubripirellula lacrimiformis TaxID=1930273 RepID=A0A517NAX1_9BACT|nr:DUF4261 domain-containing protein [Rubripirellula lacrimiformis]QDT04289.1 hypothetical protein K227x_26790 [Rubripirellula lacrimiformis]